MTNLLFSIVVLLHTNMTPVSVTTPICAQCEWNWNWPPHHHVPTTNYAPGLVTTQTWANIEFKGETKRLLLEESQPPRAEMLFMTNLLIDSSLIVTNKVIW